MSHAVPTDAVQIPPAGTYRFVPERSLVRFRTRHLFGLGKVVGRLELLDGRLVVADPPESSAAQLTIDARSFSSSNDRRDTVVKGPRWLEVDRHPTITAKADAWRLEANRWETTVEVTAVGRTVPVRGVLTTLSVEGETLHCHLRALAVRYDFGITAMKGMAGKQLELELELEAVRV